MANREEHALAGALVGFGTYVLAKRLLGEEVDWGNAVGCGVLGAGVAVLPDYLEPAANNPNHREFAHSLAVGAGIAGTTKILWDAPEADSEQRALASALAAAYLSHLAIDANTPAGLPVT